MPLRHPAPLVLALAVLALIATAPVPAILAAPKKPEAKPAKTEPTLPPPVLEADGFLPDTFAIGRVANRLIRARALPDAYDRMGPEYRPNPDSLGRARLLANLVNKELLAQTALEAGRPLNFEERIVLRGYAEQVYANALYQRTVMDSVVVTDKDVQRQYGYYSEQLRLRHLLLTDRATAEKLRLDLMADRIAWGEAARRYSMANDRENGGELDWTDAPSLGTGIADRVYPLKVGEISPVIPVDNGYEVVQVLERRPVSPPAFIGVQSLIRERLATAQADERAERIQRQLAAELGLTVDSANVAWAAPHFTRTVRMETQDNRPMLQINTELPSFTPADTGRTLASWRDGRLSLEGFLESYSQISPVMRPNVNDFGLLERQVVATALSPYMTQLALARGVDKDPLAVRLVELRREELMVERLYQDSVASRVWVRPEERRRYYDDHLADFQTFTEVTYGAIYRHTRAGIDSVADRLKAGGRVEDILRADSLAGFVSGSIQKRREDQTGAPMQRELFEDLRPGQWLISGPDREGTYLLVQVLHRVESRQLSFEESQGYIDESLQNIKSEQALEQFLERRRQLYPVESRPDLVMKVRWR